MVNPACCCTLQKATIIIAIIDMVSCVQGAIGIIIIAAFTIYEDQQFNQGFAIGITVLLYLLPLISIIITFGISWMLKTAAENKNPDDLRLWLTVTIICLAIIVGTFIFFFVLYALIIALIPGLLYRLWTLWVVYEYRKEIQPISQAGVVYASGPHQQQQNPA